MRSDRIARGDRGGVLELSRAVSAYELAQRNRIATGALLRTLAGEAPDAAADTAAKASQADQLLRLARVGRADGPSPELADLYRQEWKAELAYARAMARAVSLHPAWPWLEKVRGIGPTLAARLLARLDIGRAPTPSSFWQYCGLGTIAGERYVCASCGIALALPAGRSAPRHHVNRSGERCLGSLNHDAVATVRIAPRLPGRGQPRSFDVTARSLLHVVGTSFLRRRSRYREVYDRHRVRLVERTPPWTPMHVHLSAMRVMEKLFLAHLWLVWADAIVLPTRRPFDVARRGRAGVEISPLSMIG